MITIGAVLLIAAIVGGILWSNALQADNENLIRSDRIAMVAAANRHDYVTAESLAKEIEAHDPGAATDEIREYSVLAANPSGGDQAVPTQAVDATAPPSLQPTPQPRSTPIQTQSTTVTPQATNNVPLWGDVRTDLRPRFLSDTYVPNLVVTNKTAYDWDNAVITVNPGTNAYTYRCADIDARNETDVELDEFVNAGGMRFDVDKMKVTRVEIVATTQRGPGMGGWNIN